MRHCKAVQGYDGQSSACGDCGNIVRTLNREKRPPSSGLAEPRHAAHMKSEGTTSTRHEHAHDDNRTPTPPTTNMLLDRFRTLTWTRSPRNAVRHAALKQRLSPRPSPSCMCRPNPGCRATSRASSKDGASPWRAGTRPLPLVLTPSSGEDPGGLLAGQLRSLGQAGQTAYVDRHRYPHGTLRIRRKRQIQTKHSNRHRYP